MDMGEEVQDDKRKRRGEQNKRKYLDSVELSFQHC